MSATDHLQPTQLAMFMPAREVFGGNLGDVQGEQTEGKKRMHMRIMEHDREAGNKAYRYLDEPARLYHGPELRNIHSDPTKPVLGDGHHRLAYRMARDPESLMPVEHYGTEGLNTRPKAWWDI